MTTGSPYPIQKVSAAALAGFVTTILIWILKTYAATDLPPDVAGAVTGIIMVATAYVTPLARGDIRPTPVEIVAGGDRVSP